MSSSIRSIELLELFLEHVFVGRFCLEVEGFFLSNLTPPLGFFCEIGEGFDVVKMGGGIKGEGGSRDILDIEGEGDEEGGFRGGG